jgi:hypothetical protein
MFRRCSDAICDRCLRATAATAIQRVATVGSRNRTFASATAGRCDRHHWASAATACRQSAQRRPVAHQGRPFPRRTRRQRDRCEVCGRGTDACLRRYRDAVPRQARDHTSADDWIGLYAAMTVSWCSASQIGSRASRSLLVVGLNLAYRLNLAPCRILFSLNV